MRRFLAAAVALAPLCIVSGARADSTISGGQTGPVATATSGSVTVNSGGSVSPGALTPQPAGCAANQSAASPGGAAGCPLVGIFLNGTGTNVTNSGSIGSSSLSKTGGATGILIQGGASGDVVNNNAITLTDGFSPQTDKNTGNVFGDWSNTTSPQNNYGIRLIAGSGAFTGSIFTLANSAISVHGNNSFGISIEAPLVADGSLTEPTVVGTGSGTPRNIALETDGAITVSGNNAVGVNIAGPVGTNGGNNGDVWIKGPVTVTGQGAVGLQTSADINGRLTLGSTISATGYHYTTRPIDSTINAFSSPPFTAGSGPLKGINSETLQGGPAVVIGGSVSGGVLLDTQPTLSSSTTTTSNGQPVTLTTGNPNAPANDQDLNGIPDADQTVGAISSFGSAPALVVGGTNAITIGAVGTTEPATSSVPTGSPTADQLYNYGLILNGAVAANGVFDTIDTTAIQLGTGQSVSVAGGGLFTSGGVSATAFQAAATAIRVNSGVTLGDASASYSLGSLTVGPGITNFGGTISAVANGSGVTATSGFQFEAKQRAVAIDIESGATVPTINNLASPYSATNATINAQIAGAFGSAIAIVDHSQSNLTINNQGAINAQVDTTPGSTPQDESPTAAFTSAGVCDVNFKVTSNARGQACAIAVDARDTTGLTIIQSQSPITGASTPIIRGDVYLPTAPTANSSLQIQAGVVAGTINLGGGTVDLQVGPASGCASNGVCATVAGPLIQAPTNQLSIEVHKGGVLADGVVTRAALSAIPNVNGPLAVQSLTVDGGGTLFAAINPQGGSGYVAQTADLKAGAKLAVSFVNLPTLGTTSVFNFIQSPNLTVEGPIDTSALTHPFMLDVMLASQTGAGGLSVNNSPDCSGICVVTSAATPAGMNKAQAQFYPAAYQTLAQGPDVELRDLFLSKTTKSDFFRDYNQLMPVPAGATLLSLSTGEREVTRALADDRPMAEPGEITGWTEEINFFADHPSNDGLGFRTHGVGVASGVERGIGFGALGASAAFVSGDMNTPDQVGQSNLSATSYEAGLYWRFAEGGWRAWARGAAGYATFNSTRDFTDNPTQSLTQTTTSTTTTTDPTTGKKTTTTTQNFTSTPALERIATANWNGYTLAGGAGLSWEKHFLRRYTFRPEATVEYFFLREGGYTENNGSGGINDIPLEVGGRSGHILSTSAMLNFGARFGDIEGQGGITAELRFGYRDNVATDPGLTSVAFVDNPNVKALLAADSLSGGGPVAGFRLMAGGTMGYIALEGDVDDLQAYTEYVLMLRAAYRF